MAEKKKTPRAAKPAKASKSLAPVTVETVAVEVAPVETVAVTPVETVAVTPVETAPLSEAAIERIRARARALWEARGGSAFDNWLEAERAVRAEVQATA